MAKEATELITNDLILVIDLSLKHELRPLLLRNTDSFKRLESFLNISVIIK